MAVSAYGRHKALNKIIRIRAVAYMAWLFDHIREKMHALIHWDARGLAG
jgi:hypothetical protein